MINNNGEKQKGLFQLKPLKGITQLNDIQNKQQQIQILKSIFTASQQKPQQHSLCINRSKSQKQSYLNKKKRNEILGIRIFRSREKAQELKSRYKQQKIPNSQPIKVQKDKFQPKVNVGLRTPNLSALKKKNQLNSINTCCNKDFQKLSQQFRLNGNSLTFNYYLKRKIGTDIRNCRFQDFFHQIGYAKSRQISQVPQAICPNISKTPNGTKKESEAIEKKRNFLYEIRSKRCLDKLTRDYKYLKDAENIKKMKTQGNICFDDQELSPWNNNYDDNQ